MLLERESQLELLSELVANVDSSGGRVVLVRGEAGIGKSSVVAEFIARTGQECHILFGTCDDLLTPQTLGAFWDIARDEPSLRDPVQTDRRRLVQETLLDLLCRSLRSTVLVIEDTQWADAATLDVIKFLGRRMDQTNGLMVLTYRDTEVDLDHPLRHVIGDLPAGNIERIALQPLSAEGVRAMLGDGGFSASEVMALSDGNPLYVAELMTWGSDVVPASIHDMVLARTSQLSEAARELLELVSVVPGDAERDVVRSVAGDNLGGLSECERLGLLRSDDGSIGFVHELQRRTIENSIPPERRQALNERVLGALEHQADASRLVHHARKANDANAIIKHAPVAARAAVTAESPQEAVEHFRLLDPYIAEIDPVVANDILSDWARQEFHLHSPAALELADRAVRMARTIDDQVSLGRGLAFSARVNMQHLNTEMALKAAWEAVGLLEEAGDAGALAYALSILAHVTWLYEEDVPASLEIAERALAVADESGDDAARMRALIAAGNIEYSVGVPGGMERLEKARSLASRTGDRDAEVRALSNMTAMAADFRHMSLASDLARRTIKTAARYEMRSTEAEARAMYSEILLWLGRWSEVEDVAAGALGTQPSAETIAWRVLGTLQARRGRSEAHTALERMWSQAKDAGQLTVVDPAAGALAEYMWLSGDHRSDWLARLDEILAEGVDAGNPWPSGAFAFWMWKLDRLDSVPEGTLDMYGWIIQGDLDRANKFWSESSIPYEQALGLMHGEPDSQLEALRLAEDLGATALARRIRQHLVAKGLTPPRGAAQTTRDHVAGLTVRQAEVLDLLAAGASNLEIADELFLSPRTAENHVAAILMKLDVPNRTEAVAEARKQNILT
ncbi:MAG: ATP-binding protein [Acidimicrobiia bacterium]